MLTRYYTEYHDRIQQAIRRDDTNIAFDYHTMASEAPNIAPDPGETRPVGTLGNDHGKACDQQTTEKLAEAFRAVFKLKEQHTTNNEPFAGEYITRKYGNNLLPWIKIEMNRCLYLDDRWINPSEMEINQNRLKVLNTRFKKVVKYFFNH